VDALGREPPVFSLGADWLLPKLPKSPELPKLNNQQIAFSIQQSAMKLFSRLGCISGSPARSGSGLNAEG
jgi:hypothetical protein